MSFNFTWLLSPMRSDLCWRDGRFRAFPRPGAGNGDCRLIFRRRVAQKSRQILQEEIRRCIDLNSDAIYKETSVYALHLLILSPSMETKAIGKKFEELKELAYQRARPNETAYARIGPLDIEKRPIALVYGHGGPENFQSSVERALVLAHS